MPDQIEKQAILIAGPTASGKSSLAMATARRLGGEIVNADSMQVYRDLRIVTARPSPAEEAEIPHHLYGFLDAAEQCSAGAWARRAGAVIEDIISRGRTPVVVGGTGLYFKALVEGLSPIPDVPAASRAAARAHFDKLGADAFRAEVVAQDPALDRLPAGDTQRLLRAWEVFHATGAPLSSFQAAPRTPVLRHAARRVVLCPPRDALYQRCDDRAAQMLDAGAVEEVRLLIELGLDPALPAMKALGVAEIGALLAGEISEDDALALLQRNTRRFAKRQMTWFRGQCPDWPAAQTAAAAAALLA